MDFNDERAFKARFNDYENLINDTESYKSLWTDYGYELCLFCIQHEEYCNSCPLSVLHNIRKHLSSISCWTDAATQLQLNIQSNFPNQHIREAAELRYLELLTVYHWLNGD